MKIGIIQINTTEDRAKNLSRAAKLVKRSAEEGSELICLPEMFSCPMEHRYYKDYAEEKYGVSYQVIRLRAK